MKVIEKILHSEITSSEYSRIPHTIYEADFNTSYPSQSRINRIASEISEYLKYKRKNSDV